MILRCLLQLEMYLRFGLLSRGNLALMKSNTADYMSVEIDNDVIKLKIKLDDYFDDLFINIVEIDSSWIHVEIGQHKNSWFLEVNGKRRTLIVSTDVSVELCNSHLYIGKLEVDSLYMAVAYCILEVSRSLVLTQN